MRKTIIGAFLIVALALPVAASAEPPGGGGYGSQPGYEAANGNTTCAGHGAFGAFGTYGYVHDFGHVYPGDSNGEPGANGYQTGINNGTLCGNRQGDLP
jgi:hypothetical protein